MKKNIPIQNIYRDNTGAYLHLSLKNFYLWLLGFVK